MPPSTTIPALLARIVSSQPSSSSQSFRWAARSISSSALGNRGLDYAARAESVARFHTPLAVSTTTHARFHTSTHLSPSPTASLTFPRTTTQPCISILSSFTHPHLSPFHSSSFFSSYRRPLRPRPRSSSRSSSSNYAGPTSFSSFRRRFDRIPPDYIVYGIIAINIGIFLLWQYATASWQRFRDPALYNWLYKNFIVSEMNLAAGRVYTLLTGCFSHSTGSHIFLNCLGLYFIAPSVVALIGPTSFLALYLGGGIISSLVSLGWHRAVTGGRGPKRGSEGASGAIYAALAYYATIFPKQQFLLMFVLPVPAWLAVGGIFAYDLYSSIRSPYALTDSAGHIGGILAGVAFALASKGRGGFRSGPRVPWR